MHAGIYFAAALLAIAATSLNTQSTDATPVSTNELALLWLCHQGDSNCNPNQGSSNNQANQVDLSNANKAPKFVDWESANMTSPWGNTTQVNEIDNECGQGVSETWEHICRCPANDAQNSQSIYEAAARAVQDSVAMVNENRAQEESERKALNPHEVAYAIVPDNPAADPAFMMGIASPRMQDVFKEFGLRQDEWQGMLTATAKAARDTTRRTIWKDRCEAVDCTIGTWTALRDQHQAQAPPSHPRNRDPASQEAAAPTGYERQGIKHGKDAKKYPKRMPRFKRGKEAF
ncbi:hypothetical protein THASP1DRAFT_33803 [Thamnocephalis sphaerospora]|uniref:Uncharacterized protein n=1 Tax=Thamnocephalis sphaerospora TaxID=78915 RepID=A0A4P9XGQ9_9FUNG|nr:hypothetical protein THASP1DRAFT_33803 [Thamnocephalis sphaerospora]|eukprot:RKP04431.1 hypothetical protein THASP1DRAFT_33803 [Thamnocephalis sphaerospora]